MVKRELGRFANRPNRTPSRGIHPGKKALVSWWFILSSSPRTLAVNEHCLAYAQALLCLASIAAFGVNLLFNGDAFCKVSRLVNIGAFEIRYVIGQELKRQSKQYGGEVRVAHRHSNHLTGQTR